jgi:hypothetical protein
VNLGIPVLTCSDRCSRFADMIDEPCSLRPRGEMDIIQVSGTWGLGSIPGEGMSLISFGLF